MSTRHPINVSPEFALSDIYHVLFRRKYVVLVCAGIGFALAAASYSLNPPPYESEAKLFIRYVSEARSPAPSIAVAKSPDQRGETILDSEMEIITSRDLARHVAEALGPEIVLGPHDNPINVNHAAGVIARDLQVESPPRSSVIRLLYSHRDPAIAQRVLREVIAQYLLTHVAIHRATGMVGEFLDQETSQLRARLAKTEDELRRTRNEAGVISLDETKTSFATQIATLRQQIFATQAELAERRATLAEIRKRATGESSTETETPASPDTPVSSAEASAYRNALYRLEYLRRQEQELLTQFREENFRVRDVRQQITEVEQTRRDLEQMHPELKTSAVALAPTLATAPAIDPAVESVRITALEAKLRTLESQLDQVRADAAAVDAVEASLVELRRRQQLEETNYRHYSESLEQARLDEALGAGRVSNISQIQTPTYGIRDNVRAFKWIAVFACGGVFAGLAWAFLAEFYLDRTIKRPVDVERLLQPSLFVAVPELTDSAHGRLALPESGTPSALMPFHDSLRDHLIHFFESNGLVHKPKLVAVSGIGVGSGVSTTAVGLARSLSETEGGNVLLVDMTRGHESAQQFFRGQPILDLDRVLESRDPAMVDANLYVVAENDQTQRNLPQRLSRLVPRLKASEFDYIIFDLPPVSPTSITPRLARLMDMTLVVVEAESTEQEVLQRAVGLLTQSNVPVGIVLNKTRSYVPAWLKQDFALQT